MTAPTPEDVAATAPDESDATYQITPAADPGESAPQEALEPNALTMFLVIVQSDGSAFASSDLSLLNEVVPAREATLMDLRNGAQQVVHDANALQVAQQTAGLMRQSAMQMAEEQRTAKIAAQLADRGIKVPNGGYRSGR